MSFQNFSGGYYRATMSVQPYQDGPAIEQGLHDYINRNVYAETNAPITMRIGLDGGPLFVPEPESAIPTDVVAMPAPMLDESQVHPSDDSVSVFVLKPAFAYMFQQTERLGDQFEEVANIADELTEADRKFFNLEDNYE